MATTTFKARATVYKGIKMRSRLEAGFAQWLDSVAFKWEYEPRAFANEAGQYLPDFYLPELRIVDGPIRPAYIEVKPQGWPFAEGDDERLYRSMAIIWDSEPEAVLLIAQTAATYCCSNLASVQWLVPDLPPAMAVWIGAINGDTPLLGFPLYATEGPWKSEYWKVDLL